MIKFGPRNLWLFLLLLLASFQVAQAQPTATNRSALLPESNSSVARDASEKVVIARTNLIVREIVEKSFPELSGVQINIKTFDSRADYFRSRFSFARFLTFVNLII